MIHTKKIIWTLATLAIVSNIAFADTNSGATATGTTGTTTTSLEMKSGPTLKSKTDTTITLEWEKIPAAASYIVKFSKKSVATSTDPNAQYDEETDPIIENTYTIENLTPWTTYYFSVVAVDKNNVESDNLSDELSAMTNTSLTTTTTWTATTVTTTDIKTTTGTANKTTETTIPKASLILTDVRVEDNKTIHLNFSSPLSNDAIEAKIINTANNMDVPRESIKVDPTTPTRAIVKIATILDPKTSYSVTIVNAKDTNWNNIEKWLNGTKEFQTPVFAAAPANTVTNTGTGNITTATTGTWITWTGANVNVTNTKALPATWTKENVIILTALLISLWIFAGTRKKFLK